MSITKYISFRFFLTVVTANTPIVRRKKIIVATRFKNLQFGTIQVQSLSTFYFPSPVYVLRNLKMFRRYSKDVSLALAILLLSTFTDYKVHAANERPRAKGIHTTVTEEPRESGCKGLEGGKKYLMSDNGKMLARCNNCGPSVEHKNSVSVHGNQGDEFAQFTFEPVGDKCAIKSDIGRYIARCNRCWEEEKYPDSVFNHADTKSPSPESRWIVEKYGNFYSFKADTTGKYMARCGNCVPFAAKEDFAFIFANAPLGSALWTAIPV